MNRHTAFAPLLVTLLATPAAAIADATLRFEQADGSSSTMMIRGGQVRMEEREADGQMVFSIFDARTRKITVIMDEERSYTEMSEDTMRDQAREMRGMQTEMMSELRRQLEGLSPEERRMMEQQMAQMGMSPEILSGTPAKQPELSTRRTGATRTVNGVRCEMLEVLVNGEKSNDVCVADAKQVNLAADDYETLRSLFNFMQSLSEIALSMGGPFAVNVASEVIPDIGGIPVEVKNVRDGTTVTLTGVNRDRLDAALFQVPADYQRVDPF